MTRAAGHLDCTVHDTPLSLCLREIFRETGRAFQTDFDGCLLRDNALLFRPLL